MPDSARKDEQETNSARRRASRRDRNVGIDVAQLRRRRLKLFGLLAPVLIVLVLLAAKFTAMPVFEQRSLNSYDAKKYSQSISRLDPLRTANWFEAYLVDLNEGTNELRLGNLPVAEQKLRSALVTWNDASGLNKPGHAECRIRQNLAITLERKGDKEKAAGSDAAATYEDAKKTLEPCASGGSSADKNENPGQSDSSKKRIDKKEKEAGGSGEEKQQQDGKPKKDSKGSSPSPSSSPSKAPDPKQSELDKRNSDAQKGDDSSPTQQPDKPY